MHNVKSSCCTLVTRHTLILFYLQFIRLSVSLKMRSFHVILVFNEERNLRKRVKNERSGKQDIENHTWGSEKLRAA